MMPSEGPPFIASQGIGEVLARCFASRGFDPTRWASVSKRAGLDDEAVKRIIKPRGDRAPNVRHGTLLKIAAAMDLDGVERDALASAAGKGEGWLTPVVAKQLELGGISMRRAVLLLTGPRDPHGLHFSQRMGGVAVRSGVVFGWHDVVLRLTTPKGVSVLSYADDLFTADSIRTVETILLRDDHLPMYVDQDFVADKDLVADFRWAVIFVQALGERKTPEFPDIFREVALMDEFKGCIHILTAAVAVGQFDSVVEVLASNVSCLKDYVRKAQDHGRREWGREAHTVTYFADDWRQGSFPGSTF